jgi:hypothetical protein
MSYVPGIMRFTDKLNFIRLKNCFASYFTKSHTYNYLIFLMGKEIVIVWYTYIFTHVHMCIHAYICTSHH